MNSTKLTQGIYGVSNCGNSGYTTPSSSSYTGTWAQKNQESMKVMG
jgi:hypothetical protein